MSSPLIGGKYGSLVDSELSSSVFYQWCPLQIATASKIISSTDPVSKLFTAIISVKVQFLFIIQVNSNQELWKLSDKFPQIQFNLGFRESQYFLWCEIHYLLLSKIHLLLLLIDTLGASISALGKFQSPCKTAADTTKPTRILWSTLIHRQIAFSSRQKCLVCF